MKKLGAAEKAVARKRVLMFGCGNMGRALLSGWTNSGPAEFQIVDPAQPDLGASIAVHASVETVPDIAFDLVVIAVKPQLIPVVAEAAGELIRRAELILSIAAGTSVATLKKQLGNKPIVRMMPNMPASVRKGLSGLFANDACTDSHRKLIEAFARENGLAIWLDSEDQIDRFTAIAGSGPGYIFELLRVFSLAAEEQGFAPDAARLLATHTVLGTAEMADQSDQSLEDLRNSVTSKNGTTQAGLEQWMRDDVLRRLISDTTEAAYQRAVELR